METIKQQGLVTVSEKSPTEIEYRFAIHTEYQTHQLTAPVLKQTYLATGTVSSASSFTLEDVAVQLSTDYRAVEWDGDAHEFLSFDPPGDEESLEFYHSGAAFGIITHDASETVEAEERFDYLVTSEASETGAPVINKDPDEFVTQEESVSASDIPSSSIDATGLAGLGGIQDWLDGSLGKLNALVARTQTLLWPLQKIEELGAASDGS